MENSQDSTDFATKYVKPGELLSFMKPEISEFEWYNNSFHHCYKAYFIMFNYWMLHTMIT